MKFLIDQALSPAVAIDLNRAGHDAVHVRKLGMPAASDDEIFDRAARDDRVVVWADTDLGTLLATRKQTSPSVTLFRHGSHHRPADQAALLKANLPQLEDALKAGSIVVIQPAACRSEHCRCSRNPALSTLPPDASSGSGWLTAASRRLGEPRRRQDGSPGRLLLRDCGTV